MRIALTSLVVLGVIYIVPFLVYGLGTVVAGLKPPEDGSPARFLLSVLVQKIGVAVAFVVVFHLAHGSLEGRWLLYALAWMPLFVVGEIGLAIGPSYTWGNAIAGILSELIYVPLAAWITDLML
jgi:hypothetical protein